MTSEREGLHRTDHLGSTPEIFPPGKIIEVDNLIVPERFQLIGETPFFEAWLKTWHRNCYNTVGFDQRSEVCIQKLLIGTVILVGIDTDNSIEKIVRIRKIMGIGMYGDDSVI